MRKLIRTIVLVVIGVICIPALFMFAIGLGSTVFAFIAEPRVMVVMIGILLIISIPGIILGLVIKK